MTTQAMYNPHEGQSADEIIAAYHGWLYQTAGRMTDPSSPDLDDLVQEGRIAMWQALESYDSAKGSLPSWLTRKAKFRMIEIVTGGRNTGAPSIRHGRNPAADLERSTLSLDAKYGQGDVTLADLIRSDTTDLDAAELTYHYAEIERAIMDLPDAQRKYVVARFWEDMNTREMQDAGIFNYDASALWHSQRNGIRMKFREVLKHLADAE